MPSLWRVQVDPVPWTPGVAIHHLQCLVCATQPNGLTGSLGFQLAIPQNIQLYKSHPFPNAPPSLSQIYLSMTFNSRLHNSIMNLLRRRIELDTFVGKTHLRSKGRVRLPLGRVARVGLFHHLVDLLEGKAFGFGLWAEVVLANLFPSSFLRGVVDSQREDRRMLGKRSRGSPRGRRPWRRGSPRLCWCRRGRA